MTPRKFIAFGKKRPHMLELPQLLSGIGSFQLGQEQGLFSFKNPNSSDSEISVVELLAPSRIVDPVELPDIDSHVLVSCIWQFDIRFGGSPEGKSQAIALGETLVNSFGGMY